MMVLAYSGCTDPLASNYNALATIACTPYINGNPGCCNYPITGCTDPTATNYNPLAITDDGSCIAVVNGCTDASASNYDATANTDDGSCIYTTYGCTDPTAFNYNAAATSDDGSCIPYTYGCTDPTASNYNALANTDDGSCITCVYGCTNPNATNYNANATCADGSCIGCLTNYSGAGSLAHIPDIHFRNLICSGCLIANGSTASYVYGPVPPISLSDWRDLNGNPDVNGEYILMSRITPVEQLNIAGNYTGGLYPNGTYSNDSGNLVSDLTGINCFTSLTHLNVQYNTSLTSIDLSLLPSLQVANIQANPALTSINTQYVTSSAFWWLTCRFNINLQNLDVSTGNQIKKLDCRNNDLYTLNVANNLNYTWSPQGGSTLDARNNPNLTCINVDTNMLQYLDGSVYWFNAQFWKKDAQAIWSDNC
jgi:hypothetical protein